MFHTTLFWYEVITLYCLCSVSAWSTTPRLSHRFGWLSSKFWMSTQSPNSRGGSSLVCWLSLSWSFADLGASASSLPSATDFHTSWKSLELVMWGLGLAGMKSQVASLQVITLCLGLACSSAEVTLSPTMPSFLRNCCVSAAVYS